MFFDGKVSSTNRNVSAGGKKTKTDTKVLLENAKKQREEREALKIRSQAALVIQSRIRRYLALIHTVKDFQNDFDKKIDDIKKIKDMFQSKGINFRIPVNTLSSLLSYLFFICRNEIDYMRLILMQKLLVESISLNEKDSNYLFSLSPDLYNHPATYRYAKLLQFSLRSLKNLSSSSSSFHQQNQALTQENTMQLLRLTFFEASPISDLQKIYLAIGMRKDLLSKLKQILIQIKEHGTIESLMVTGKFLLQLLFSLVNYKPTEVKVSQYQQSTISMIFFYFFTLPNILNHPLFLEQQQFLQFLSSTMISSNQGWNFKKIISNIFLTENENTGGATATFSIEKLYFLSNYSQLLLHRKKESATNGAPSSSSSSSLINAEWIQFIYDLFFQFTPPSGNPTTNAGVKPSSKSKPVSSYFPLASALHFYEYGSLLTVQKEVGLSGKMELDEDDRNHHEGKNANDEPIFELSESIMEDLISDYGLLDSSKKLEFHNIFLTYSIQLLESNCYNPEKELFSLVEAVFPIIKILTDTEIVFQIKQILLSNIQQILNETSSSTPSSDTTNQLKTIFCLIRVYSFLLSSFSIDLTYPLISTSRSHQLSSNLANKFSQQKFSLLTTLTYSTSLQNSLIYNLWNVINKHVVIQKLFTHFLNIDEISFLSNFEISNIIDQLNTSNLTANSNNSKVDKSTLSVDGNSLYEIIFSFLYFFGQLLFHKLTGLDDNEFFGITASNKATDLTTFIRNITTPLNSSFVFPLQELTTLIYFLKQFLFKFYWNDIVYPSFINLQFLTPKKSMISYTTLLKYSTTSIITTLYNHLCIRNERRKFLLTESDYQWNHLRQEDFTLIDSNVQSNAPNIPISNHNSDDFYLKNNLVKLVLLFIPQVIPFKLRVQLFQSLIEYDKINYYHSTGGNIFTMGLGNNQFNIQAKIRRDHLLEDTIQELNDLPGYKLKGKIQIEFVSEQGYQEAGIDGGGIFKEFMETLAKEIFDPEVGLFITTSDHLLIINPNANIALGENNYLNLFYFVGKMLGKALYEKLLFQSEFSLNFLNMLLGRSNEIDDFYHYDEQIYNSLMNLKRSYLQGEDISNFELHFEITRNVYDRMITEELIPNGSNTRVTNANVLQYIHRYVHYLQNSLIAASSKALLKGFHELITLSWLRIFNSQELQLLMNGESKKIDIQDLQRNVVYGSGYHESQPYIQAFWQIIDEMSIEDQKDFLKFVTSSIRQPLLGFKELNPKFCIQKVSKYVNIPLGSDHSNNPATQGEVPRLPSAATCMNLLKLPQYDSIEMLKDKLLYAIRSKSGFELS